VPRGKIWIPTCRRSTTGWKRWQQLGARDSWEGVSIFAGS
jgi:hypothetical protein